MKEKTDFKTDRQTQKRRELPRNMKIKRVENSNTETVNDQKRKIERKRERDRDKQRDIKKKA